MSAPRHAQDAPTGLAGLLYREPVRLYVYGVVAAVVALLVFRGVVSGAESLLWLALAQVLLAVPATEAARARVDSPATSAATRALLVQAWEHRADLQATVEDAHQRALRERESEPPAGYVS